jgi:hypothetical protein
MQANQIPFDSMILPVSPTRLASEQAAELAGKDACGAIGADTEIDEAHHDLAIDGSARPK